MLDFPPTHHIAFSSFIDVLISIFTDDIANLFRFEAHLGGLIQVLVEGPVENQGGVSGLLGALIKLRLHLINIKHLRLQPFRILLEEILKLRCCLWRCGVQILVLLNLLIYFLFYFFGEFNRVL